MRSCGGCGQELRPGAKFCPKCGAQVSVERPEDQIDVRPTVGRVTRPADPGSAGASPPAESSRSAKTTLLIAAAIGVLIGIPVFFGVMGLVAKGNSAKPPAKVEAKSQTAPAEVQSVEETAPVLPLQTDSGTLPSGHPSIGENSEQQQSDSAAADAVPFDAQNATRVPSGMSPREYVEKYYRSCIDGNYRTAYDMLPADKKAAVSADDFAEQIKGYGMTAFNIRKTNLRGDDATVEVAATTSGGDFGCLWTFVKGGDGWLVKSRVLSGMNDD